jgi:hypothetical protein
MHRLNAPLLTPVVPESSACHSNTALKSGIADTTLRPQVLEELLTRHHLVRVGQEIDEYLEDLAVKGDRISRAT